MSKRNDQDSSFKKREWEVYDNVENYSDLVRKLIIGLKNGEESMELDSPLKEDLNCLIHFLKREKNSLKQVSAVLFGVDEQKVISEFIHCLKDCCHLQKVEISADFKLSEVSRAVFDLISTSSTLRELKIVPKFQGGSFLGDLCGKLASNQHLQKLEAECFQTELDSIGTLLSKNDHLQEIAINISRDNSDFRLFESLGQNMSIKKFALVFYESRLPLQGLHFLVGNQTLTSLKMENFVLSEDGIRNFSEFVGNSNCLTELDLSSCIDSAHLSVLIEGLYRNGNIKSLILAQNFLGVEESKKITKFLENNSSLTQLCLNGNEISEGVGSLIDVLKVNTVLKVLDISSNNLNESEAEKIAEYLVENKFIEQLNIGSNYFNQALVTILSSLRKNKSLKALDCSFTVRIKIEFGDEIAKMIQMNEGLTELKIGGNPLTKFTAHKMLYALTSNDCLQRLDLSPNFFHYLEVDAEKFDIFSIIALVIRSNNCLRTIEGLKGATYDHFAALLLESLRKNSSITNFTINFSSLIWSSKLYLELLKNRMIQKNDSQVKLALLILQRRRDGNIVSSVPRRLIIYLLSFIEKIRKNKYEEGRKEKNKFSAGTRISETRENDF